jgi:putative Mn2+ efflux pump MntP
MSDFRVFERIPFYRGSVSIGATLLIALGLAMDAFAVSVAAALVLERVNLGHLFRLAFHFGLFQFLMPVLGWLAGGTFASYVSAFDHWVAFALLASIGGRMLWESRSANRAFAGVDPTRGWILIALSVATSIDALAVGLSLALLEVSVWAPAVIIGLVAAAMSAVGAAFGSRLGKRWERRAEAIGGLLLIAMGLHVLWNHLAAGGQAAV